MNKHILVVDDSPSIRQMVQATLMSANYEVSVAEDGKVAFDMCKIQQYDFVLTDQNMPNMDGITLIKSLREVINYKKTPIVVLTTEASTSMKEQGRAAGATGWMVKPFDPDKLLTVASRVLS